MNNRTRIVTGTALALVMAASHAAAAPQAPLPVPLESGHMASAGAPQPESHLLLLAQAEDEEGLSEEERLRRQQQQEAPPAEEPAAPPAEEPAPAPEPEAQPPAAQEAPAAPEPAPQPEPAPEPEVAPEVEPAPAPQPEPEPEPQPEIEEPAAPQEAPVPEEAPVEEPTAPQPVPQEAPAPAPAPAPQEQPPVEQAPVPQPAPSTDEPLPTDEGPVQQAPSETAPIPIPTQPPAATEGAAPTQQPAPTGEAPILDSEKEGDNGEVVPEGAAPVAPVDTGPPPTNDAEAQQLDEPLQIESLRVEEGRRIDRREERIERREGTDVLREIGDRIILQFNNQTIVRGDDRGRMERDASEVYYEELPRGRSRETIVRPNGVQVVTIRDRYGDVIRRSRIMPDGQEYVLVYGDDRNRGERREWRDPARELPPLRLTIPREEYILDARRVQHPEDYYDFLEQPPVERVRRLYSIDEVRYSARVRDSVRRIDLDTITFDFGAASIAESEIRRLEGVATAMERLLDENPAETFLIEGHTDAVGSDQANLALSDRRAESVAAALTNVFGIPPENLVTQGYGERYLKVNTQEPERANRRVAMRRITPLVAPVAEAR